MTPPPSNDSAVIIFDWDDTILPSSFVDRSQSDNLSELPPHTRALFREIEICTEKCLAAAASHGEVIIITNSDEGWVKYSAERYLPNLIPVLKSYRIISARTRYEKFYPNQPLCWKAAAFAHEVNEHFCSLEDARDLLERECGHRGGAPCSDGDSVQDLDMASTDVSSLDDSSLEGDGSVASESPGVGGGGGGGGGGWANPPRGVDGGPLAATAVAPPPSPHPPGPRPARATIRREVVSFGDSVEERTAVKIVSDQLDAVPKSVKFLNNPTPAQIVGQLAMITHHMGFVCDHVGDLDLEISHKQAERCASGYLARRGLAGGGGASPSILQRILGTTDGDAGGM
ncbi:hypothetical protein ACHAW5_004393 [Stephanodiscus triporus]|uniref:Uncharacterized protein n=1 Tax=Stephanodiscus triporus TaxID=2934178 RepID=A0ABD3QK16_9STRA